MKHIKCHCQSGNTGAFADTTLQHIQFIVLNGEFYIEHIMEVFFKNGTYVAKFFVGLWHKFLHGLHVFVLFVFGIVIQWVGSSNTSNNVFTLSIYQPFTIELVVACCGITGKGYTCCGIVAHIAEYHGLNIYCCTPIVWNSFNTTV